MRVSLFYLRPLRVLTLQTTGKGDTFEQNRKTFPIFCLIDPTDIVQKYKTIKQSYMEYCLPQRKFNFLFQAKLFSQKSLLLDFTLQLNRVQKSVFGETLRCVCLSQPPSLLNYTFANILQHISRF